MLERYGSSFALEGMMWSVVMLSSIFSMTSASISSARGSCFGKGLMFGPRMTSTSAACSAGGNDHIVVHHQISPAFRHQVWKDPEVSSASDRYAVDRRDCRRFRADEIDARTLRSAAAKEVAVEGAADTASVAGDCPMPMHGPQAHSRMLAHLRLSCRPARRSSQAYSCTCLEPGEMVRLVCRIYSFCP